MRISIMTFGYERGAPEGDFAHIIDVRNIPTKGLNVRKNGLDPSNYDKIMSTMQARAWLSKMKSWSLSDGDRIAVGCSHGIHRSVALARAYSLYQKEKGNTVSISNRDINKG